MLDHISFIQHLFILLFIIVIYRYIRYEWQHRHIYKLTNKLKGPKPLPFLGNALIFYGPPPAIFTRILQIFNEWKTPIKLSFGPKLFVIISKPEHIKILLTKTLDKGSFYDISAKAFGNGLFSAPVSIWKKHRKIIQPTFNQKILDKFVSVFNEQSVVLAKVLEKEANGNYFDVFTYLNNCTIDTICENAFGVKVNTQTGDTKLTSHSTTVMNIIFQRTLKVWLHFDLIFNLTSSGRTLQKSLQYLRNFCMTIIKQRREEYNRTKYTESHDAKDTEFNNNTSKIKPFLQLLLESTDLNDEQLFDEVLTTMIAGSDTTATTTSFCLMMLGMHQEVQQKVYEEIDQIFHGSNRPVLPSDLSKLKYLEMVIKETLRILPAGPLISRLVTEEFQIDEYTFPKGLTVVIAIIETHRNPELWPNPERFDPQRFLPENCAKRHPYSFIPFSGGPRNCIGLNYAYMSMKTFLVNILRNYKIHCDMKIEDIKLHIELVLRASDGFQIKLNKRY